jgi:hypothetical protein
MSHKVEIAEWRFLGLIEHEKQYPKLKQCFLRHLVLEWKKTNPFKTEEQREHLLKYIDEKLLECGCKTSFGFNNSYNNNLQFLFNGEYFFVQVTAIDFSTGLSTE